LLRREAPDPDGSTSISTCLPPNRNAGARPPPGLTNSLLAANHKPVATVCGERHLTSRQDAMFRAIREQIDTIFREDPAAKSVLEIFLCYPGFHAILLHRLAHRLYDAGVPLVPRVVSQVSRFLTGIEIHPGATIGRRFFIDHGSGVVIGETTEIGDDCLIYQGVTLGGTGNEKGKRHPTLGNRVVVGTGAKVLGSIRIGDDVKIGAGSVVVHPVPDGATVVGIPGRVVRTRREAGGLLEHGNLPDPEGQAIDELKQRVAELETQLRLLAERLELEAPRKP
jgi:serine O-acetyltransferase